MDLIPIQKTHERKQNNTFRRLRTFYIEEQQERYGVGFLISNEMKEKLVQLEPRSQRRLHYTEIIGSPFLVYLLF